MYKTILKVLGFSLLIANVSIAANASCPETCQKTFDEGKGKLEKDYEGALRLNKITESLDKAVAATAKDEIEKAKAKALADFQKDLDACKASCG